MDDLIRTLSEKYVQFAKSAEALRLFQSGILIKEENYRDAVDERNPYRAVFVERKNKTHVDELKPFVGLTTGGAQVRSTRRSFEGNEVMALTAFLLDRLRSEGSTLQTPFVWLSSVPYKLRR